MGNQGNQTGFGLYEVRLIAALCEAAEASIAMHELNYDKMIGAMQIATVKGTPETIKVYREGARQYRKLADELRRRVKEVRGDNDDAE